MASGIVTFLGLCQGAVPLVVRPLFGAEQRIAPALWLPAPWWWIACLGIVALTVGLLIALHAAREKRVPPAPQDDAAGENPQADDRAAGYDALSAIVLLAGCEEILARGFLAAIGLGHLDVVGSQGTFPARRAMGESKVTMLVDRGHPPPWTAVCSDSASDLPLFSGTPRPVLVNAGERAVQRVALSLGRRPETVTWR